MWAHRGAPWATHIGHVHAWPTWDQRWFCKGCPSPHSTSGPHILCYLARSREWGMLSFLKVNCIRKVLTLSKCNLAGTLSAGRGARIHYQIPSAARKRSRVALTSTVVVVDASLCRRVRRTIQGDELESRITRARKVRTDFLRTISFL